MDFSFTERERAFREELRAFFREEVPPELLLPVMFVAVDFSDASIQTEWRRMARLLGERRWLSLTWPRMETPV